MSSNSSNSSWFASKRYKKKPQIEKLPELRDDIADDDVLNTYRPGMNVDPALNSNSSGTLSKKNKKKQDVIPPPLTTSALSSASAAANSKDKCNCCRRTLVRKDKAGLSFTYPKCRDCGGKLCRSCTCEKGRCHECAIKEVLKNQMIPDMLLQIDRQILLGYIEKLHYPIEHFRNWENKYLVKQILVRYDAGNNWDPKFHGTQSRDNSIDESQIRKQHVTTESDFGYDDARKLEKSFDSDIKAKIDAEFQKRLSQHDTSYSFSQQDSSYMEDLSLKSPYGPIGYNTRISGRMQSSITEGLKEVLEDKNRREEVRVNKGNKPFDLLDITTPAYFDNLSSAELRTILKQLSVAVNPNHEKHELKFAVLKLWNDMKARNPAPIAPAQVQVQVQMAPVQQRTDGNVKWLLEIPSVDAIEDLSTKQMTELMQNLGRNVKPDCSRRELLPELTQMWHEMKRYETAKQQPIIQERVISLSDIRAASDIEKLSPTQLHGLLANNGIDPRQYPQPHEKIYMIRQIWYRTQQQRKDNGHSNVLNRSMETPYSFDERYRASMRQRNLTKGKSMNQLDALDDAKSSQVALNPFSRPVRSQQRYRDDSVDTIDSGYHHQQQQKPLHTRQMSMPVLAVSLEDIRHPEDIQELHVPQLRTILVSKNVDVSRIIDKSDLVYSVKELWMAKKAQESDIERRKAYEESYNRSAFTPVNYQTSVATPSFPPVNQLITNNYEHLQPSFVQRTVSLQDIKRPEEIATLSRLQMRTLLERYKIHVRDPQDKSELMELTRRLWIKRNGETVTNYVGAEMVPEKLSNEVTKVNKDALYAKITPSALRKSFRSEEQLSRMDQMNVVPIEPQVVVRNPSKLVEVSVGETQRPMRHSRGSGMWKDEEFRTSSPINLAPNTVGDLVNEIAAIQSLEDIRAANIIPRMTVRQMKYILSKHEVDFAGCSEKKEFEIHLTYLWKKNRNNKYPKY